jgi:hypothetical protein
MITEEKLTDWQCRLRTIQQEMREAEESDKRENGAMSSNSYITCDARIAIEEVLNTLSLIDFG